jgi:RimJ/RimL family protein N-acetyltransferase
MTGSSLLPTPTLHTARLRLRPFDDADANDLFELHSSAYVVRYWDAPPWSERVRAERFIAACRQMAQEGTGARLAVDRVSDGTFIGWCSLNRWNPDYRSASLGYCFDDAAWGHGYATEAARMLLRWAFDTLDLNRVQAETDTRNVASARVLEKLGFVREGTLREDCVVNGEVSDSWVYGLIRREWRPSSEPVPAAESLLPRETSPAPGCFASPSRGAELSWETLLKRSRRLSGPWKPSCITYLGEWPDADQETSVIMDAALGQVPRMCPPAERLRRRAR